MQVILIKGSKLYDITTITAGDYNCRLWFYE